MTQRARASTLRSLRAYQDAADNGEYSEQVAVEEEKYGWINLDENVTGEYVRAGE